MRPLKRKVVLLATVVPSLPLLYVILLWLHQHNGCPQQPATESRTTFSRREGQLDRNTKEPSVVSSVYGNDDELNIDAVRISEDPDIEVRGKYQQQQINEMCRKHFFSGEQRLPSGEELNTYFRHLMFDDRTKTIFCFVPKIGCTNLKRLMLYTGGHLPMNTLEWPWVEDRIYLEPALSKASLLNKTLSLNEKIHRLKTYFKFMIVRNPLERLVSAYRNKIEAPVSYNQREKFPEHIKVDILLKYRDREFHEWQRIAKLKPFNISVTFPEYIRYFTEMDLKNVNEHFKPSIDICHPCLATFNFYGNFRNISTDMASLIKRMGTEKRFYRDGSLHREQDQTDKKLLEYYSRLSTRERVRLVGKLYDDLLFYYTLYPSQRHSHYRLLGIQQPIT